MVEDCVQPFKNMKQVLYTKSAYRFWARPYVTNSMRKRARQFTSRTPTPYTVYQFWTVCDMRCTVYGVQCAVHVVRCKVSGARYTLYGVGCKVFVCGARYTVYGEWCTVYGERCTMHGAR